MFLFNLNVNSNETLHFEFLTQDGLLRHNNLTYPMSFSMGINMAIVTSCIKKNWIILFCTFVIATAGINATNLS